MPLSSCTCSADVRGEATGRFFCLRCWKGRGRGRGLQVLHGRGHRYRNLRRLSSIHATRCARQIVLGCRSDNIDEEKFHRKRGPCRDSATTRSFSPDHLHSVKETTSAVLPVVFCPSSYPPVVPLLLPHCLRPPAPNLKCTP